MIGSACVALLLAAAGPGDASPPPHPAGATRFRYRERVIVRVPTRMMRTAKPVEWHDRKGPRCVALGTVAAAAITKPDSVDLVIRGGQRVRAELERACPALDFYSGFYVRPTEDRMICADRDAIHARSGGECEIERFRKLTPKP